MKTIRRIAQTKRRLSEIEVELQDIRKSDLAELEKRVDEGTKLGRDVLGEMASAVTLKIEERRTELRKLREA